VQPILFQTDSFVILSYYLVISFVYSVGLIWVRNRAKKNALDIRFCMDLCLTFMIGGFIGARLFHVLYEDPRFFYENPNEIFKVWKGGFVFFGGFIGALVSCLTLFHFRKKKVAPWLDVFAPVLAMGYGIGRIGCFLNGCCYGRACELAWAVDNKHPTQLYASFWELSVMALLLWLEKRKFKPRSGQLFYIWLTLHGLGRIIMEYFRDDPRGPEPYGLSIATYISLVLIISGLFFILKRNKTA